MTAKYQESLGRSNVHPAIVIFLDRSVTKNHWAAHWVRQCMDCRLIDLSSEPAGAARDRAERIEQELADVKRPILIVAEGSACDDIARWATQRASEAADRIIAAVLSSPSVRTNFSRGERPDADQSQRLPFPTVVIGTAATRAFPNNFSDLARQWGSTYIEGLKPRPAEGLCRGDWPLGKTVLAHFMREFSAARAQGRRLETSQSLLRDARVLAAIQKFSHHIDDDYMPVAASHLSKAAFA